MDLIYFHKNCPDGFCAAFIAKKRYPEATMIGLNHGEQDIADRLVEQVKDKNVLMVDFSLRTRGENIRLFESAKSFKIFDHHKTAKSELADLPFAVFDMERSGAGITWDELFGKYDASFYHSGHEVRINANRSYIGMPETIRPWYVDYVQDRDLWKHGLQNTKAINAYIMTLPFSEEAWRNLDSISANEATALGRGALAHVEHYVREIVEHRQMGILEDLSVAIVNAPYLNISEVGHVLATFHAQIGMGWFERGDGKIQFSLRSTGDIDVSKIAKAHGGGGHNNAAGFQLSLTEGRKLLDGILGRT